MSSSSAPATWLDRSRQRWKLWVSVNVGLGVQLGGLFLYARGTWPEAFIGLMLVIAAGVAGISLASFIRCRVCGYRVTLNAPFGRWWSHSTTLQACPECNDDGEARPPAPGDLSVWFQVAREVAAREREERRRRNRVVLRVALVVFSLLALGSWFFLDR